MEEYAIYDIYSQDWGDRIIYDVAVKTYYGRVKARSEFEAMEMAYSDIIIGDGEFRPVVLGVMLSPYYASNEDYVTEMVRAQLEVDISNDGKRLSVGFYRNDEGWLSENMQNPDWEYVAEGLPVRGVEPPSPQAPWVTDGDPSNADDCLIEEAEVTADWIKYDRDGIVHMYAGWYCPTLYGVDLPIVRSSEGGDDVRYAPTLYATLAETEE